MHLLQLISCDPIPAPEPVALAEADPEAEPEPLALADPIAHAFISGSGEFIGYTQY